MTSYIYDGPANRLRLSGQTLVRGTVVQLDGRAAEAAERHPHVRSARAPKASGDQATNQPDGLVARRALVARAKELGIPATGKSDALKAAIAEAEAAGESEDDAE
jgi:hypothetical protein